MMNRISVSGCAAAMAAAVVLISAVGAVGCAAAPAEHSYVTDYQIIGDRTVKYIYRPGDRSRTSDSFLDQGLSMEICTLVRIEHAAAAEDVEEGDEAVEAPVDGWVETDCEETRILKTEEYR